MRRARHRASLRWDVRLPALFVLWVYCGASAPDSSVANFQHITLSRVKHCSAFAQSKEHLLRLVLRGGSAPNSAFNDPLGVSTGTNVEPVASTVPASAGRSWAQRAKHGLEETVQEEFKEPNSSLSVAAEKPRERSASVGAVKPRSQKINMENGLRSPSVGDTSLDAKEQQPNHEMPIADLKPEVEIEVSLPKIHVFDVDEGDVEVEEANLSLPLVENDVELVTDIRAAAMEDTHIVQTDEDPLRVVSKEEAEQTRQAAEPILEQVGRIPGPAAADGTVEYGREMDTEEEENDEKWVDCPDCGDAHYDLPEGDDEAKGENKVKGEDEVKGENQAKEEDEAKGDDEAEGKDEAEGEDEAGAIDQGAEDDGNAEDDTDESADNEPSDYWDFDGELTDALLKKAVKKAFKNEPERFLGPGLLDKVEGDLHCLMIKFCSRLIPEVQELVREDDDSGPHDAMEHQDALVQQTKTLHDTNLVAPELQNSPPPPSMMGSGADRVVDRERNGRPTWGAQYGAGSHESGPMRQPRIAQQGQQGFNGGYRGDRRGGGPPLRYGRGGRGGPNNGYYRGHDTSYHQPYGGGYGNRGRGARGGEYHAGPAGQRFAGPASSVYKEEESVDKHITSWASIVKGAAASPNDASPKDDAVTEA